MSRPDPHVSTETPPVRPPIALEDIARIADRPIGLDGGRILAASLVAGPCRAEVRNTCSCSEQKIVFYTGPEKRREYSLCLGTSTKARILAHWECYAAPSLGVDCPCVASAEVP